MSYIVRPITVSHDLGFKAALTAQRRMKVEIMPSPSACAFSSFLEVMNQTSGMQANALIALNVGRSMCENCMKPFIVTIAQSRSCVETKV